MYLPYYQPSHRFLQFGQVEAQVKFLFVFWGCSPKLLKCFLGLQLLRIIVDELGHVLRPLQLFDFVLQKLIYPQTI